ERHDLDQGGPGGARVGPQQPRRCLGPGGDPPGAQAQVGGPRQPSHHPHRRDHNNPAGPSPSGADAQPPNDPRADLVTLAAVITAWAYSNWADRWPGLGWTPRGRAV